MRLPRMLRPLRIRDFALLWTGMTTSLVGDFVFFVAYPWQTYQLTNDPTVLGWISAAYVAPTVVFVTVGGVGGLGQALFGPAFGSIVPEIVPAAELPQANALDQFVRTGAGLVGPAV